MVTGVMAALAGRFLTTSQYTSPKTVENQEKLASQSNNIRRQNQPQEVNACHSNNNTPKKINKLEQAYNVSLSPEAKKLTTQNVQVKTVQNNPTDQMLYSKGNRIDIKS
jgi:cell division protein FtsN